MHVFLSHGAAFPPLPKFMLFFSKGIQKKLHRDGLCSWGFVGLWTTPKSNVHSLPTSPWFPCWKRFHFQLHCFVQARDTQRRWTHAQAVFRLSLHNTLPSKACEWLSQTRVLQVTLLYLKRRVFVCAGNRAARIRALCVVTRTRPYDEVKVQWCNGEFLFFLYG